MQFEIYHGDTVTNDWDILRELNPAKKPSFDAIVANPWLMNAPAFTLWGAYGSPFSFGYLRCAPVPHRAGCSGLLPPPGARAPDRVPDGSLSECRLENATLRELNGATKRCLRANPLDGRG